MLNQTGIEKESFNNIKNILVDEKNSTAVSIVVANTGVVAGDDGKKIIKAGTPVYGSLEARNTPFTIAGEVGATPAGIILHDVDVTTGNKNSQIVIFGTIDVSKLDTDVQTALTASIKSSLKMVQFIK